MLQLIYASAQTTPFTSQQLSALLAKARANNQRLGVSGLLLYHQGSFLQMLEGDEPVVTALYDEISKDRRHNRIVVLKRATVTERSFADWSMGFVEVSPAVAAKLEGFSSFLQRGSPLPNGLGEQLAKVLDAFRSGAWRQYVR